MLFICIWINPQIIENARANLSVWHFIGVDIDSGLRYISSIYFSLKIAKAQLINLCLRQYEK